MDNASRWSWAPAPLAWVAAAAGLGIALARIQPNLVPVAALVGATAAIAWLVTRKAPALLIVAFGVYALYGHIRINWIPPNDLRHLQPSLPQTLLLRGVVTGEAAARGGESGWIEFPVQVDAILLDSIWRPAQGRVLAEVHQSNTVPACGDRIEAAGFLHLPPAPRNPGAFNRPAFLAARGIHLVWTVDSETLHVLQTKVGAFWERLGLTVRDLMRQKVELGLKNDPQISALMAGMLFGFRQGIDPEINEAFRRTGTIHLFAVSGQNVAVITGVLLVVLRVVGILPFRWGWVLVPVVLLFCLGTGLQPSAIRASLMAALVLAAWALRRPVAPLNLLGTAALLVWTWDPHQLFDLGFQLSFFVVLALVLAAAPLTSWGSRFGQPDPWIPPRLIPPDLRWRAGAWRTACAAVAVSTAAWTASAPFIVGHFHLISLIGIVANLLVVPLASLVVVISGLSVVLGSVWAGFAILFNQVNWLVLHLILTLVSALSAPPWAALAWSPKARVPVGQVSVWILEGRRAFPSIIRTSQSAWLIDTGSEAVWRWTVNPARRALGVNQWNGVILTQASLGFSGGAVALGQTMPTQMWAEGGWRSRSPHWPRFLDFMEETQQPKQFWSAGDRIDLGQGLSFDVFWPPRDIKWARLEDQGLVLRLNTPHGSILWAGEISSQVEAVLVQSGRCLRADVLVQGEHPRESNWTQPWLDAVQARHLIRARQGFHSDRSLTPSLWAWAAQTGTQIWLMDFSGAIDLTGRHGTWILQPFVAGSITPPGKAVRNGPNDRLPRSWPQRHAPPPRKPEADGLFDKPQ